MRKLEEKVIVTRGYLFMWRALMIMFSGTTVLFAGMRSNLDIFSLNIALPIIGCIFIIIGLAMLGMSFRYSYEVPKIFNSQEKRN